MESSKGQQFILVKSDAALGFLADRTIIAAQNSFKTAGFLQDESSDSNLEARTLGAEQRLTKMEGGIEKLKNDLNGDIEQLKNDPFWGQFRPQKFSMSRG